MRSFLIAVGLVVATSCAKAPHVTPLPPDDVVVDALLDLRHPIYIVVKENFWSGCDTDSADDKICRTSRMKDFNDGVNQWLGYFVKATRPKVVYVNSETDLPADRVNPFIYLWIKQGSCPYDNGKKHHQACFYKIDDDSAYIAFENTLYIFPGLAAHEFGHALGRSHDDMPTGATSIMLPIVEREARVLPRDIDLLCKIHAECPPHRVR